MKEISYNQALEMYNRWGRTILIGTSDDDFYSFKKEEDNISLDECIKKWKNYHDGDAKFFLFTYLD